MAMTWPDGARVAVLVSYMLETWSEGKCPSYYTRTSPLKPGFADLAGIEWSRYGGMEGGWRILRLLDKHGVRGSMLVNGKSAELYPDLVKAAVQRGHPLVAHGYLQDELPRYLDRDSERAVIARALDAIEKTSGQRPIGWATQMGGHSEHTRELLVEAKVEWTHDAHDRSTPYVVHTDAGSITLFPWTDFVDNRLLKADPSGLYHAQKDAFDYCYSDEPMGIIHIALHSHAGGRPTMVAQVDKLLSYFKTREKVWFTTSQDIVKWMQREKIEDLSYRNRFFDREGKSAKS